MAYKLLSLDTSSSATGWALFVDGKYTESGLIDLKKIKNGGERLANMILELDKLINHYSPNSIVVENTVVLRNPAVQRMLTMILGAVYGKCVCNGIEYQSLRPTEWRKAIDGEKKPKKRDELKEWSKQKAKDIFGVDNVTDDVSDAMLIGQAYINLFNNGE